MSIINSLNQFSIEFCWTDNRLDRNLICQSHVHQDKLRTNDEHYQSISIQWTSLLLLMMMMMREHLWNSFIINSN